MDHTASRRDMCLSCLTTLHIILVITTLRGTDAVGYCQFPWFLHTPHTSSSGTPSKIWLSRTGYENNTATWTTQREMTVRATEITVKTVVKTICTKGKTNHSTECTKEKVVLQWVCVSEEPDGKYRVQVKREKKTQFTCLKFEKRNRNLIQIWQAEPSKDNEAPLCYSESLERDPWPWIAIEKDEWSFCPITGGYDFRAIVSGGTQKYCHRVWRPSRLESECVMGEGVQMIFPDERCSFFQYPAIETQLYCWASWEEQEYLFIVLGEQSKHPQYTLRMPLREYKEFVAYFYFAAVAPMRGQGRPPDDVMHLELRMSRSGTGTCYDESEHCSKIVKRGGCASNDMHKYGNYCKKSCGLCELIPSSEEECRFPRNHRGDWVMFERHRREDVTIASGQVTFSHLGRFVCKSKHWSVNHYKVYSHYDNGCRPRYSCLHMKRGGDKTLLYKLSRSSLADVSFNLCTFEDDPQPLGDSIRSSALKIMYGSAHVEQGVCGLSASVNINATFPDGVSCAGTLSDWDKMNCHSKPELGLSLYPCAHSGQEFICTAYVALTDEYSVLITQSYGASARYTCWIIEEYGDSFTFYPWKVVRQLNRAQCGDESDLGRRQREHQRDTVLSLRIRPESMVRQCGDRKTIQPALELSTKLPHGARKSGTVGPGPPYTHTPGDRSRTEREGSNPRPDSVISGTRCPTPTAQYTCLALLILSGINCLGRL